jgi:RNA polymerase sigma factor (TIGR02999 family)
MSDPLVHVGTVIGIGPVVLRDKLLSTGVQFDDGTQSHVLSSTPEADGMLSVLQDALRHHMLVYVEIDEEASSISGVLVPQLGYIRRLGTNSDGDCAVEMGIASSLVILRQSHPRYRDFLLSLESCFQERRPIAITVAPIGREVLDVREAPAGAYGLGDRSLGESFERQAAAGDPCASIAPVSSDSANCAFAGIVAFQCDSQALPPCIPFRYVDNFCQARAHMMAHLLTQANIESCKIWAYGPLGAPTANSPTCFVEWTLRHVAPAVRVGDGNSSQLIIFDPSLCENGPVPLATWLLRFQSEPPFATRCTSSLVLDQPYASGPQFDDDNLTITNAQLVSARAALVKQIQQNGAPPYAACGSLLSERAGNEEIATAGEITRLLAEVREGDAKAREILCQKVYAELHRLALIHLRNERPGHMLQPTLLVHDAYLNLVAQDKTYNNRHHFFAVAAGMMRRLLVDHARHIKAEKRGGDQPPAPLNDRIPGLAVSVEDVLAIDEALEKLRARDERQSRVVEMKIFAGLPEEDIAEFLQVSTRTVKRDWKSAKAWLAQQLRPN